MDWSAVKRSAGNYLKKYGYVILILGVGVILMCLPSSNVQEEIPVTQTAETIPQKSTQTALEEILCQVSGAGRVKVLLTVEEGATTIFQTDHSTSGGGDTGSVKVETVVLSDGSRGQQGLVRQINPPVYLGAVVVCQGADSAAVRLAVTEAVAAATGLTADKITVLKMK